MFRALIQLTKPGIVIGNVISVTGGYLLASRGNVDWKQGCLVAVSVALTVASGCVLNNVADRDIDGMMVRTRSRPMVRRKISVPQALLYGFLLGFAGIGLLYYAAHRLLPVYLLLTGYAVYVGLYTLCLKRNSVHGTLVGSIAGAMPPVVGYCTASGSFDCAALALATIFSLWQMPHSYAIAIFRDKDYRAAGIPVLPVVRGFQAARLHITIYILGFTVAALGLGWLGYAGKLYMLLALASGAFWFWQGLTGWTNNNEPRWARKIFFTSIAVVVVLCLAMSLDYATRPPVMASLWH